MLDTVHQITQAPAKDLLLCLLKNVEKPLYVSLDTF